MGGVKHTIPRGEEEVQIKDLKARCNFSRYWVSTDDSWVCTEPATSLVLVPDAPRQGGKPKLRCDGHEGMLTTLEQGVVVKALPKPLAEALLLQ